jgi:ATP-dependent helicase/nuclease subunit B
MTSREHGQRWAPLGERLIEALRDEIAAARSNDPLSPITVVVPSFYSAFYLRRRLATDGPLFNVQFTRLEDLSETLAGASNSRPPLSRLRAAEMVYIAAADPSVRLPGHLDLVREHESFRSALHRTLDDLRFAPHEMTARLSSADDPTLAAIGRTWEAFQKLSSGYDDQADVAERAAAAVTDQHGATDRWGTVLQLQLEDPAPQFRVLQEALKYAPKVTVLAGRTGDHTVDRLITDANGPQGDGAPDSFPHGTRLVSAPSRAEEARWIAREILIQARQGTPFNRMAVLYDTGEHGARLIESLRAGDIPVCGPDPGSGSSGPEGRWLPGLLEARRKGLSRVAVMNWLANSPVSNPITRVDAPAARWEALSRRARVSGGVDGWGPRLKSYASGRVERAQRAVDRGDISESRLAASRTAAADALSLKSFMEAFTVDSEPPPDGSNWSRFSNWISDLTSKYFGGDGDARDRINVLLQRLADLDELEGDGPTCERFETTLRQQLAQPGESVGKLGSGVLVAPLRQAAGCDFDLVLIPGMAEGAYPARPTVDPLLPDDKRATLDPDGEYLRRREHDRISRRREYLIALGSASERILIWPRAASDSGRAAGPASWFLESARYLAASDTDFDATKGQLQASDILELRGRGWITLLDPPERAADRTEPASVHEYDVRSIARWIGNGNPVAEHFLANDEGSSLGRAVRLEAGRQSSDWTAFDGNLSGLSDRSISFASEAMSPTRLQSWATCPFQYFLESELGLHGLEEPDNELLISPMERGSIVHKILELFTSTRRHDGDKAAALSVNEQFDLLEALTRTEFAEARERGVTGHPALWRLESRRMEKNLAEWLRREIDRSEETGMSSIDEEVKFGLPGSDSPAVDVDIPGMGTIRFRGIIDRIDKSDDGSTVKVVDYKTGNPDRLKLLTHDLTAGGTLLQLPVYIHAARALYPDNELEAGYWFVFETGKNKEWKSATAAELQPSFERSLRTISHGIQGGVFPARPGNQSHPDGFSNCGTCDFDSLCPSRRDRLWDRKKNHEGLAEYRAMAEGPDS